MCRSANLSLSLSVFSLIQLWQEIPSVYSGLDKSSLDKGLLQAKHWKKPPGLRFLSTVTLSSKTKHSPLKLSLFLLFLKKFNIPPSSWYTSLIPFSLKRAEAFSHLIPPVQKIPNFLFLKSFFDSSIKLLNSLKVFVSGEIELTKVPTSTS